MSFNQFAYPYSQVSLPEYLIPNLPMWEMQRYFYNPQQSNQSSQICGYLQLSNNGPNANTNNSGFIFQQLSQVAKFQPFVQTDELISFDQQSVNQKLPTAKNLDNQVPTNDFTPFSHQQKNNFATSSQETKHHTRSLVERCEFLPLKVFEATHMPQINNFPQASNNGNSDYQIPKNSSEVPMNQDIKFDTDAQQVINNDFGTIWDIFEKNNLELLEFLIKTFQHSKVSENDLQDFYYKSHEKFQCFLESLVIATKHNI